MSADFLQFDLGQLRAGDVVEVDVKNRQNVLLLDAHNFSRYRRGDDYKYFGGEALRSPIRFEVPHVGHWYVVGDLGGCKGRIEMSVEVHSAAA